jgi:hypothetical protein
MYLFPLLVWFRLRRVRIVLMNDVLPCLDLLEATPDIRVPARLCPRKPAAARRCIGRPVRSRISQMLHEWALHDIGHIRQIAELVRARKYLAGAGPLGGDYQLKP